jgi:5S rRNA maturation endonuclease (ribonuclease M5)
MNNNHNHNHNNQKPTISPYFKTQEQLKEQQFSDIRNHFMVDLLIEYLDIHGIKKEHIEKYGLVLEMYSLTNCPAIHIPIRDENNKVVFKKTRLFSDKPNQKYLYDKGSSVSLFNLHQITPQTNSVILVEGEFDAIALQEQLYEQGYSSEDVVVLSTTGGSKSWNSEKFNHYLENKHIVILYDNDTAGAEGAWYVAKQLLTDTVHTFKSIAINALPKTIQDQHTNEMVTIKDVGDIIGNNFNVKDAKYIVIDGFIAPKGSGNVIAREGYFDWLQKDIYTDKQRKKSLTKLLQRIIEYLSGRVIPTTEFERVFIEAVRKDAVPELNRLKQMEKIKKNMSLSQKKELSDKKIQLQALKKVPITNFLTFDRSKKTQCIFHDDTHPSLTYNDEHHPDEKLRNTVKCFACGKFAGVVDVVMKQYNVDFKDAVEIIKKYL